MWFMRVALRHESVSSKVKDLVSEGFNLCDQWNATEGAEALHAARAVFGQALQQHPLLTVRQKHAVMLALEDCISAHHQQLRINQKTPYAVHPIFAAWIFLTASTAVNGLSPNSIRDTVITLLIHDIPEENPFFYAGTKNNRPLAVIFKNIQRRYGVQVSRAMKVLTKPPGHSGTESAYARAVELLQMHMMLGTTSKLDDRMTFTAPEISIWAKLCDRLANMMDVSGVPKEKQKRKIAYKMQQAQTEFEDFFFPRISKPLFAVLFREALQAVRAEHQRRGIN